MAIEVDRIDKSTRKLRKLLKKQPSNPTAEQVHDLRTHTRRLEAAVDALALSERSNERRLLKRLKSLRKRTGKVRDMDVFTAHAITVNVAEDERDCLVRLLERLGADRYRHVDKLLGEMHSSAGALRWRLMRTLNRISAMQENGSSSPSGTPENPAALAIRLSTELAEPLRLNKSNLHPFRLKVKELRYVLQMAADPQETVIDDLGKVKDAIGEWHDWEELLSIASELNTHGQRCQLVRELTHIASTQFERALALTNRTRTEYLTPGIGHRKASPVGAAGHASPRILAAAAALADRS